MIKTEVSMRMKKEEIAMVVLLLLHPTGFYPYHPHCKLVRRIKVPHWLKEILELIRAQTRLLIGIIGTGLTDGLFLFLDSNLSR